MAQKVYTTLVDDIDGTELGDGGGETVNFALDGTTYEIDLSSENADMLRTAAAAYIASARRVGGTRSSKRSSSSPTNASAAEIRAWGKSNGYKVPDRGRVPADVREAYEQSN